jgi:hypothetical protein
VIPEPAVNVDATGAAPVDPIKICPFVGAVVLVRSFAVPEYKKELAVKPEIVREVVIVTALGKLTVTLPVAADNVIWFAVPAIDVTPVFAIVIDPAPFVTLIAVPAVKVPMVGGFPVFPIKSCPLVGAVVVARRPAVSEYKKESEVKPDTVRELVIVTLLGKLSVTAPVDADTLTLFAVPDNDVTPAFVIVTSVAVVEKLIPVPLTKPFVAKLGDVPLLTNEVVPAFERFTDVRGFKSSIRIEVGVMKMKFHVLVSPFAIVIGDVAFVKV